MPSDLPYVAGGVIWGYFTSHVKVSPISGGQCHNCVHPLMVLNWPYHYWGISSSFFLLVFLRWVHHDIS